MNYDHSPKVTIFLKILSYLDETIKVFNYPLVNSILTLTLVRIEVEFLAMQRAIRVLSAKSSLRIIIRGEYLLDIQSSHILYERSGGRLGTVV